MEPNDDERSHGPADGEIKAGTLPAWRWTGAEALELVCEINECCLVALRTMAEGHLQGTGAGDPFDIVKMHQDLWLGLDEHALRRAARVPCLLVSVHFHSEEWWPWARSHRATAVQSGPAVASFPETVAREIMKDTLDIAWHTARADRPTATVLLGIVPAVAARIAALSRGDARRIAAEHWRELRPRFEENLTFWQNLLLAAPTGDAQSLSHAYWEAIQVLGTEVLPGIP
jgi:hypothetical protein